LKAAILSKWNAAKGAVTVALAALAERTPAARKAKIELLTKERDEARLMLTLLAAEIVQSKRRPSKPVEKLLEQYLPVAREW
jgi:thymidylate kinase